MSIEKIADLTEAMNAIVADAEGRSMSDEEVAKYEELEKELQAVRKTEQVRARNDAYKAAAPVAMPKSAEFDTEDPQERAFETYLRTGIITPDMQVRAQSSSTTAGGYLVPDGFRQKLVDVQVAFGGVASLAETITTATGAPLEWPSIDDTSNTSEIVAENGAPASAGADLVFGTVTLGAYKYQASGASHLMLKVPVELLQDAAFDVRGLVGRKLGERIARLQATDFALGTGSGEPDGIAYAADGDGHVELADGNAITAAKLRSLYFTLDPAYRANATWVMHDSVYAEIAAIDDGNNRPLLLPQAGSGISGSIPMTLFGSPIVIDNSFNSKSGDNADNKTLIVFGDVRESYVIRRVKDVYVVVDPYTYALNGQVGFTAMARADATVQNAAARKILAGFDATA